MRFYYFILIIFTFLFANQNDAYNDRLLFCIKKEIEPLTIQKSRNEIRTGVSNLNFFLSEINAANIESWLPGSTDDDHDGDIYLNRIYRVSFPGRTNEEILQIKTKLEKISEVY